MTKVAADEAAIKALQLDGTRQRFKVVGIPRLYVCVEPSGLRTYHCIRHVRGLQQPTPCGGRRIGNVNEITSKEAALGCQIAELKWRIEELEAELQDARGNAD